MAFRRGDTHRPCRPSRRRISNTWFYPATPSWPHWTTDLLWPESALPSGKQSVNTTWNQYSRVVGWYELKVCRYVCKTNVLMSCVNCNFYAVFALKLCMYVVENNKIYRWLDMPWYGKSGIVMCTKTSVISFSLTINSDELWFHISSLMWHFVIILL